MIAAFNWPGLVVRLTSMSMRPSKKLQRFVEICSRELDAEDTHGHRPQ